MPKLLIVDDNELNIDMLSKWLKKNGFDIIVAQNGQEGITKASTESPDLVLMDLTMPVTDGWQATAKLKSLPETRSIPVIALSAHDSDEDRLSALEAGCDDYECKPLNLKRVTEKICQLLESSDRKSD